MHSQSPTHQLLRTFWTMVTPPQVFSVNCGVRQGDPLAPMLFNLALEPLLAAFRLRLQGVILPWGSFKDAAFADDTYAGLSPGDVEPFCQTVRDYCDASNSRININKSSIISLHPSNPSPLWLNPLGIPFHPPSSPIRVLGYQLQLCPTGISDDWTMLYDKLKATSQDLGSRSVSLIGCALLTYSIQQTLVSWPHASTILKYTG